MKVNEGEAPQYYVENSHPAIVTAEMYDMVQEELARRKMAGRQHNGTSCFAGKIFCGCCGEMYSSKVWHSNDKYRRTIWQCNAKFSHNCDTPYLTETEIQQRFLHAFNRLLDKREFIIEDTTAIMEMLTATTELDAEAEMLREEMDIATELIRQAIEQNARMAMDQEEYSQRDKSLSARFSKAAERVKELDAECARRKVKRNELTTFIKAVKRGDEVLTEFSVQLWNVFIERVTVDSDGKLRFVFKNGVEMVV